MTRLIIFLLSAVSGLALAQGCAAHHAEEQNSPAVSPPAPQATSPLPREKDRSTSDKSKLSGGTAIDPNDPVEREFKKLMQDDDDAAAEVDGWIKNNQELRSKGGGVSKDEMSVRITTRLAPVRKAYEDFLKQHPDHVRAHLAFGGFLNDIEDEDAARKEFERAVELDPKDPAAWNNLANLYSHIGPPSKMFDFYSKSIELSPHESVYYQNLADAVFVYRTNAMEYYHFTNVQQVFNKSLELMQQAVKYDPDNFTLATEMAQNYYGIIPTRTEDALQAWTNALKLAHNEVEREGVYVHLARFKLNAGRLAEARAQIESVTNSMYNDLKARLLHNIELREKEAATNSPPAKPDNKK